MSPHHTALTGPVDAFSTFDCVEPHSNMAKGAHLKFRSCSGTNWPISHVTRSVAHVFTRSSGMIPKLARQVAQIALIRLAHVWGGLLPFSRRHPLQQCYWSPPSGAL